jgi:MSHA biogenesis protein MshK
MSGARLLHLTAAAALAALSNLALAQGIADPTRPPPGVSGDEIAEEAVRGPVLQSIMITPNKRSAIISGQPVELGGRYGDARVAAIREGEVVLRSKNGSEVLKLYPDVHKRLVARAKPTPRKPKRSRN